MEKLLIVDDDKGIQKQLKWSLSDYDVVLAGDREGAVAAVRRHEPKVITLDLGLPPDETNASEGLAALQEILTIAPHTKVIVITGNDDRTNALTAIAAGAYDFYQNGGGNNYRWAITKPLEKVLEQCVRQKFITRKEKFSLMYRLKAVLRNVGKGRNFGRPISEQRCRYRIEQLFIDATYYFGRVAFPNNDLFITEITQKKLANF